MRSSCRYTCISASGAAGKHSLAITVQAAARCNICLIHKVVCQFQVVSGMSVCNQSRSSCLNVQRHSTKFWTVFSALSCLPLSGQKQSLLVLQGHGRSARVLGSLQGSCKCVQYPSRPHPRHRDSQCGLSLRQAARAGVGLWNSRRAAATAVR